MSSAIGLEDNPSKRELAKLWGSDPVHLTPEGYKKLGEKIVEKGSSRKPKPANPLRKKMRKGGRASAGVISLQAGGTGTPGKLPESGRTAAKELTRPQKENSSPRVGLLPTKYVQLYVCI